MVIQALLLISRSRLFVCGCVEDDRGDTVQAAPDIGPTVKSAATAQMDAAVIALSRELSKLRTGRATPGTIAFLPVPCCCYFSFAGQLQFLPQITKQIHCSAGMLDHIMVETADVKVALNRIAVVSVLDAHTLSVMPYDPSVRASLSLNLAR